MTRGAAGDFLALGVLVFLTLAVTACRKDDDATGAAGSAAAGRAASFVGRERCAGCHQHEDRMWLGSHHDLAMQEATAATVLGDFDDASFTHRGVTSTFFRRGDRFWVRTEGPDGELQDYEIAYTAGAVPLQQYLIGFPGGRYQALSICWDTRPAAEGGQRWFHLYPEEDIPPGDPLHWTGPNQNWNSMCAECHSTNLQKNYRPAEDRYDTTWSELDVSCEACHGPGSQHVAWAEAVALGQTPRDEGHRGLAVRLEDPGRDTWIVHPETGKGLRLAPPQPTAEIDTCARCHSRRSLVHDDYVHGQPLLDTHRLALLEEGLYHADGQILEEVYVHGSFLQSKMYQQGVTCADCHDAHSLTLRLPGDAVCARCHAAGMFATGEHHFHKPGSEGSFCVDCHMPPKNYMVVDPRHDHSLRVPRPDLSVELGTPNACNGCHAERSPRWAAQTVAEWYGPKRRRGPHYGEALRAGRQALVGAESSLARLVDDAGAPAIVRATAVALLARYLSPASMGSVRRALEHPDPLLRLASLRSLEQIEPAARLRLGTPLLDDPVRAVRIQAGRVLATVPAQLLAPGQRSRLERVLGEFRRAQLVNAERPDARLNLGWLHAQRGDLAAAEREYELALELAPWFTPAYVNLADLYRVLERDADAERLLRQGLERNPEDGDLLHSLGLVLVRRGRLAEAVEPLERAAALRPDLPHYGYVFAVALHSTGATAQALEVLEAAHRGYPAERELLQALATISRDAGDRRAALAYAKKLLELAPQHASVRRLVEELAAGGS